jgi:hypothetical protein
MKKTLHITITEPLPPWAQQIIDMEKKNADGEVEVFHLTAENAPAALEKIFVTDSVCVWPGHF